MHARAPHQLQQIHGNANGALLKELLAWDTHEATTKNISTTQRLTSMDLEFKSPPGDDP
jgi:hypothetical protein